MIARLKGMIAQVMEDQLILDVGGVGYLVSASRRTLDAVPVAGEVAMLHIETIVREDAISLYGFISHEEQETFRLLTSVQGVGARVALAILSALNPQELENAIAAQDKTLITRANGVGPKLAGRIVNELKDKVAGFGLKPDFKGSGAATVMPSSSGNSLIADAVSALVNLGYGRAEAHGAVARVIKDDGNEQNVSMIIRDALKELSAS